MKTEYPKGRVGCDLSEENLLPYERSKISTLTRLSP